MNFKFFPVILTAALTSVGTLFAVKQFSKSGYLGINYNNNTQPPVNYVSYSGIRPNASSTPIDFRNAAASSVQAVVHIKTTVNSRTVLARDPFAELFGDNGLRQYRTPEQMGSGSGVVISPDGYIVTNNHVVANADIVTVTFNNRQTAQAKLIGTDPSTDLAVLKINQDNLPYMEFGNSDDVALGEWVLAVGYPLSLDATVTAGIVSAKARSIGINQQKSRNAIESFIQTDAAVNPGNSGGPLVSTNGQLIGINAAIASPTGSYAGYSYAIPANIVKKAVTDIIQYGKVQRGYLGIEPRDFKTASEQEIKTYNLTNAKGVLVASLAPQGAAKKAGIAVGDFITAINGNPVNTIPELNEQLARYKPGDHINVAYLHAGRNQSANVALQNSLGNTDIINQTSATMALGAAMRSLTSNEQRKYQASGGVLITDPGKGPLSLANVRSGYVITGINGQPVSTPEEVELQFGKSGNLQLEGFYPGRTGMYYYNLQLGQP